MACEVCHTTYILSTKSDKDAKPHVCNICGESFSLKIQLKRHTLLHANGEPFVCINCTKHTEKNESKTYNLRLAKKNDGYVCEICNESFSSKRLLLRHSTKEHTFETSYFCDDCPEIFDTASDLKKHVLTHKSKTLSKKRTIRIVSYQGSTSEYLDKPIANPKNLLCHLCNKSFAYQACLDKHIQQSKCKSTTSKSSLKKITSDSDASKKNGPSTDVSKNIRSNVDVSESNDKKHVCNVCGKGFMRKSALEGHEILHVKEKFDSAEEDNSEEDESDDSIPDLKKTSVPKINIKQSYMCESCNFVCFSKMTLAKHTNSNHKEEEKEDDSWSGTEKEDEPEDQHECSKCGKYFDTSTELQHHSLIHIKKENDKKSKDEERGTFPCEICEKVYHTKGRLKKHLLFHVTKTNEDEPSKWQKRKQRSKDFSCDICGKRFAGETCLKKHSRRHEDGIEMETTGKRKKQKTVETLICEFCNQEFTGRKGAYVKHIHSHTPEVCGICDERFVDRQGLREHCKIHVGTEEGRMFMECSQKALDAKNGVVPPEPKVEYIYLVLR